MRPRRGRRGQVETIAERPVLALERPKAGAPCREITRQIGIDVHTAHGDISAGVGALREQAVAQAQELRALELRRLDAMVAGLWPRIRAGNPPSVTAAIKTSERRVRLLGLGEPVSTKTEVAGTLSVAAETPLKAEAEELRWLTVDEPQELAEKSQVNRRRDCSIEGGRTSDRGEHDPSILVRRQGSRRPALGRRWDTVPGQCRSRSCSGPSGSSLAATPQPPNFSDTASTISFGPGRRST